MKKLDFFQPKTLFGALVLGVSALSGLAHAQAPASVSVPVSVPAGMTSAPFNVPRSLTVPPEFSISVYARVSGARFMAVAPNNDVLVSNPGQGKVFLVRSNANGTTTVSDFATGLRNPHDIVFHTIGTTTYVYIAESNQINRYVYNSGDTTAQNRQIVISGLPDSSSSELQGAYGHQLKNIALDGNNKLYLSIASASNADVSDALSTPVRCAIYQYDADGSNGRLFARGLRNAEGLAIVPGTNTLWVAVNNRDNLKYPFRNDFDGDGTNDFGKVLPSYVDNHPPEEFTSVKDGGNYGWPYANPNPDSASGLNNMPFDFDYDNNRDWSVFPESTFTRIDKGIQAHSAPLGLSFLQDSNFPSAYRNGAVLGYHGSWNRQVRTGYKVAYFPWNSATQLPGNQMDLVTGWVNSDQSVWGRPVDAVPDKQGNLLISDDQSGTIYKLSSTASSAPVGTGTGLRGQYFSGVAFNTLVKTQTDAKVDFDWGNGAPTNTDGTAISGAGTDNFSVRWSGQVQAREAGTYTFQTTTDDGVRLSLNGATTPQIDQWLDQGPTAYTTTVTLTAGQKINLKLEYYERGGGAVARLAWKRPGQSGFEIVPSTQLYPESTTTTPVSYFRIKNRAIGTYLYDAGDLAKYASASAATTSLYQWEVQSVDGSFTRFKNRSTGDVLHIENNGASVQCTPGQAGWWSSQWIQEDAGSGNKRLKNRWQTKYIHVQSQNGNAQSGTIQSTWTSAQWVLEPAN